MTIFRKGKSYVEKLINTLIIQKFQEKEIAFLKKINIFKINQKKTRNSVISIKNSLNIKSKNNELILSLSKS